MIASPAIRTLQWENAFSRMKRVNILTKNQQKHLKKISCTNLDQVSSSTGTFIEWTSDFTTKKKLSKTMFLTVIITLTRFSQTFSPKLLRKNQLLSKSKKGNSTHLKETPNKMNWFQSILLLLRHHFLLEETFHSIYLRRTIRVLLKKLINKTPY